MKITIHGVGYVGLVTAVCFAEAGYRVVCYDINHEKIDRLQKGKSPIFEPGLESLLEKNLQARTLSFTQDLRMAVNHGLYQFITVDTPSLEDGSPRLDNVLDVAHRIGECMQDYKLVVTKSTAPVGTSDLVRDAIQDALLKRESQLDFDIAANPEFLKEGEAILDFMQPDRIIIGVASQRARKHLRDLYAPFVGDPDQILMMDVCSAELAKYASNAMLAARISFMNEIARLAEKLNADIDDVKQGMALDPRIGPLYLNAGLGYGGSCFPKDLRALIHMGTQHQVPTPLLKAVEVVNQNQKHRMIEKISHYYDGDIKDRTIAVWGLAFKPCTDDVREASSAVIVKELVARGAKVKAYDPIASNRFVETYGQDSNLSIATSAKEALKGADCLVIVTEWQEFEQADYALIKSLLKSPVIFDGRNVFDPVLMGSLGFTYFAIGRGACDGLRAIKTPQAEGTYVSQEH